MLFTTTRTNGGKTRSKIHVGKNDRRWKNAELRKKAARVLLHAQDRPRLRLFSFSPFWSQVDEDDLPSFFLIF
jgi:hypothetical protein